MILQGGWRPEDNTLSVDVTALNAPKASTSNVAEPAASETKQRASHTLVQGQPQHAGGPFAGLRQGVQSLGGAAAGAVQQLQGFAAGRLGQSRQQER